MNQTPGDEFGPSGQSADDVQINQTYVQALYVTFWNQIYLVLGLAHAVVGCLLIKWIWAEPLHYGYVLAFLISAPLAYFELEWFARVMRWESGPILDWQSGAARWTAAGFVIALGLAGWLTLNEATGRASERRAAADAEAERMRMHQLTSSPDYKRGVAAMEAMRAAREKRDAASGPGNPPD